MEQASKAVDSVVDSVKKVTIGEKKQKPKKEKKDKSADGGADDAVRFLPIFYFYSVLKLTKY